MLSLSPFFIDPFAPTLSAYNMHDCRRNSQEQPVNHREPNYSLTQTSQAANLEVELPGVGKENVKLDLAGNKMSLIAERFSHNIVPDKESTEKRNTETMEAEREENDGEEKQTKPGDTPRPSVVYALKLRIGNRYDMEAIEASMEGNGLLKLRIPTRKMDTPRSIDIQ